jgi:hypothetical protein
MSPLEHLFRRKGVKRETESFELLRGESGRRRPKKEPQRLVVMKVMTENIGSPPEKTEPQDQKGSHRSQRGVKELLLSAGPYRRVSDLLAYAVPECNKWSVLSKRPHLRKEIHVTFDSIAISIGNLWDPLWK